MSIGPVVLSVAGDTYAGNARILAVVWTGGTTAGNTVVLSSGNSADILWKARADGSNTYLGINLGPHGLHAPDGFRLSQISAGELLVYLRED